MFSTLINALKTALTFQQQADVLLTGTGNTAPVSTTLYEVLATKTNVRIISIETDVTWETTQPTPLEVVVTIDGVSTIFTIVDPVNTTKYFASLDASLAASAQILETTDRAKEGRPYLSEGRNVKVEIRITWATTQPTPLVCRVKYAKR